MANTGRPLEPALSRPFSALSCSLLSFASLRAALWHGSLRHYHSVLYSSFGVGRAQSTYPVCSLSIPQPRHVCSCLGKDDMVMNNEGTQSSRRKEEDLLSSFKQMLLMDENSFFDGTDDDDEDRGALKDTSLLRAIVKVTVKRTGDEKKYIASVLAIGAECDLALLTVQDDEFWKDAKPVEFGGLPNLEVESCCGLMKF